MNRYINSPDKMRAEGKLNFVYMTAASNKFLRIYYARVKECMATLDEATAPELYICYYIEGDHGRRKIYFSGLFCYTHF